MLLNTIVFQNWQRESADSPPTPIMSYYSFLNVSLHFKNRVIFPGGSTDPPCRYVVTPMHSKQALHIVMTDAMAKWLERLLHDRYTMGSFYLSSHAKRLQKTVFTA